MIRKNIAFTGSKYNDMLAARAGKWVEVDTTNLQTHHFCVKIDPRETESENCAKAIIEWHNVLSVKDDDRQGKCECTNCGRIFNTIEDYEKHREEAKAKANRCKECPDCYQSPDYTKQVVTTEDTTEVMNGVETRVRISKTIAPMVDKCKFGSNYCKYASCANEAHKKFYNEENCPLLNNNGSLCYLRQDIVQKGVHELGKCGSYTIEYNGDEDTGLVYNMKTNYYIENVFKLMQEGALKEKIPIPHDEGATKIQKELWYKTIKALTDFYYSVKMKEKQIIEAHKTLAEATDFDFEARVRELDKMGR